MILGTNNGLSRLWKTALLALSLLLTLAGCSDSAEPIQTAAPASGTSNPTAMAPMVRVVATTNIVADWVKNIGGNHVEVFSLVPTGVDPHSFQPGAKDVAKIADADLVLSVGLGLEESWLKELVRNAVRDSSNIVELAEAVDPIEFAESHAEEVNLIEGLIHVVHEVEEGEISPEDGLEEIKELLQSAVSEEENEDHGEEEEDELPTMVLAIIQEAQADRMEAEEAIEAIEALTVDGEDEHKGHSHGIEDPHFWFDPIRVKTAVDDIASRLSALDPDRGDAYRANASAYNEKLDDLHTWTEEQVSAIPEDRRVLITSHDSLGYFANLYGFEVVGVVLSITTEVEPSPEDLVDLVEEAEEYGVPAVFGETTVSERLAKTVATESGAEFVALYSGSLASGDSPAGTYLGMVRTNVDRIVQALK